MAGRKPTPKEGLLSLIMSKIGLVPAKKKKKGRRKGTRPQRAVPSYQTPYGDGALQPEGFDEAVHYAAAAAAGYAPVPSPLMEPLFPSSGPDLPHFAEDEPLEDEAWLTSPQTPEPLAAPILEPAGIPAWASVPEPQLQAPVNSELPLETLADGKLFSGDALENSLDDLFAGLEMGNAPTSAYAPSVQDSSPTWPAGQTAVAAPALTAAPVAVVKTEPIVAHKEPIVTDAEPIAPSAPMVPMQAAYAPITQGLMPGVLSFNSQELRSLLRALERVDGVAGSLLVGYDGLLILATALPPEWDGDYVGAQASSVFGNSIEQVEKMGRGELRRLTLESESGLMVMTAADMGILVVISQVGRPMDTAAVNAAVAGALGRA